MKSFFRQQRAAVSHLKPLMYSSPRIKLSIILLLGLIASSCISPKETVERAKLLKAENATREQMLSEIDRFAKVTSLRARVDFKLEDNSYAEAGIAEKFKTADGEVVVQRPANILLKIQLPIIKSDVTQMTSDGKKFRVAVLMDGAGGKYRNFVVGSNNEDYSPLQKKLNQEMANGDAKELKQNINAFADIRPQHFTDAMLVNPIDQAAVYVESSIVQEEYDFNLPKKSPLRWVLRSYYLIDELKRDDSGNMRVMRRFWFDRVGGIRLARQQIFDSNREIESDITYGAATPLGGNAEMTLPIRIVVTRPKEKYKMSLTYQTPENVSIGKTYPERAFVLENSWNLPMIDLDEKLKEHKRLNGSNGATSTQKQ